MRNPSTSPAVRSRPRRNAWIRRRKVDRKLSGPIRPWQSFSASAMIARCGWVGKPKVVPLWLANELPCHCLHPSMGMIPPVFQP